jgi:4-hydroxyphenylpyruvate dioxygenase
MRRGIATVCLSGTLEEKLVAAAAAGFSGVEVFEHDLVTSALSPAEVRARAGDLGLSIDLYQPLRDFEAVPADLLARNLRRAEAKFDVMAQLGADTVLVCSNVSPDSIDDDDLAAEQLHELARRAGERGLRVAYEALAWGRHVHDYGHSWDIVHAADIPALGLCLDSFHVLSRGSDPAGIRDIPADKLFFLQLAEAPVLAMDVLQWSRHYRCFPGQGAFDLPAFVEHVLCAGYTGPLSLEVFNDVFRQSDARRTAVDAMRSLLALEESLSLRLTSSPARPRVELHCPPPPVEPSGYAFVELAVDASSGLVAAQALSTLGFVHAGQHRSKPVALWEHGGASVLLNHADRRGTPEGPVLTALAVETADPATSARRAEALLAPVLPRSKGPSEVDLSAVAAPDGTSVFFTRTDAQGPASWRSDFIRVDASDDEEGGALTGIDHVALTQPFDHFDEAALFYPAVLGLRAQESLEVAAPYGLVRSRAVRNLTGSVRFALNVSLLGRGGSAPGRPEPQHVAFGCDDVFAAARLLRRRGAALLHIPDNYYADLDAREELPADLLRDLREHSVMYDADRTGAFFHFYTALVGSSLFFEVVQRTQAYDGYGAVNAPVRMAAQRSRC